MVQAGALEAVLEPGGEPLVLPEHDADEDRAPFSGEPGRDSVSDMPAQAVGSTADPAALPDDAPLPAVEHDMDAAPGEPATLVELAVVGARLDGGRAQRDDGALRRGATERELQQHTFPHVLLAPAPCLGRDAHGERGTTCRTGDDRLHRGGAPDVVREEAAVEGVETEAAPPPAREQQREHRRGHAGARAGRGDGGGCRRDEERRRAGADDVRERHAAAGREHEQGRPRARDHGVTRSRSCSMRAGPMPGIASKSSTELKPPCWPR